MHQILLSHIINYDDTKLTRYLSFQTFQYDKVQEQITGFRFPDDQQITGNDTMSYSWLKIPKGLSIITF